MRVSGATLRLTRQMLALPENKATPLSFELEDC